ncbi:hypothetical protein BLEM_1155 [Bifidobacterium lemurum]|uniref:Antitoxin FitA-like ribbon-helix-helix domain-containing protein n=1 Tax=Bifidobacterium lemurum TaxID=1603886 RepID=A0A261FSB2_9BIFI|nr:Arc family DNA-binding protein [Bifidobacterium lemurum]OZG62037.1 hypothetical protein BLEM_1155 [Bifidobacterium lemurum]QOL34868.1 Arc family DNA-binding protein [Bifidobacterium lemurum]
MATFTLRKLDDEVAEQFKQMARDHGRSAEAELRSVVEEVTRKYIEEKDRTAPTGADWLADIRRIMSDNGITEDDEPLPLPDRDFSQPHPPFADSAASSGGEES